MLQVADRYGYELRLFDEAGFAYRGPMLSIGVKKELFWNQVPQFPLSHHSHIKNESCNNFYVTLGISFAYL